VNRAKPASSQHAPELANHEIVALAVYLLGGSTKPIETEDIAVKANQMAPGRFTWTKYRNQINLEIVRVYLSDAKKPSKGAYLDGSGNEGWSLTPRGLAFAREHAKRFSSSALTRAKRRPGAFQSGSDPCKTALTCIGDQGVIHRGNREKYKKLVYK
jgi:hypothetical protein